MMLKTILVVSMLYLGSCGTAAITSESDARVWRGVVVFSAGEFQIYETGTPNDVSEGCISGSLPLDLQKRAAEQYNRSAVIIVGRSVPWPTEPLLAYLEHRGGRVSNECGGDYVIFASEISAQ